MWETRAFHIKQNGEKKEITNYITNLTISGEYRDCSRSCNFGIVHGHGDKRTQQVQIQTGDHIRVIDGGNLLFHGVVWTKNKATETNDIDFTCQDFGIYLKKNKASYNFKNTTAMAITKQVCADFGIAVGSIAPAGGTVTRTFMGVPLYDIIMTAYTLSDDKKYYIFFEGQQLYVHEKGKYEVPKLESGKNLLTSTVSESLASMVNRVRIYNKEDTYIEQISNETDAQKYGYMTEILRISKDGEDYKKKANEMLQGIEQKISVTNFGNPAYRTGKKVQVVEPYTGLTGIFYIDADEHNWKNGIYTNKLTLNFKNIMDERESGTDGNERR